MPTITFRTNPVEREVDGKKSRTSLAIEIDRSRLTNLKDLKMLFLAEAKKQGIYLKVNAFEVNGHSLTDLSEIDRAAAGSDFIANVTQLTEHELNVLKTIKVLKEEIEENKNLLTKMSITRGLLQEQLRELDIEINSLTNTSQVLREQMLEKAAELQRLVPTTAKLQPTINASIGKQAGTMFANQHQVLKATVAQVTKDINSKEIDMNNIEANNHTAAPAT